VSKSLRRLGVSDPPLWRGLVFRSDTRQHQADIVAAICLDGRVEKQLLENVPLRVAAAELIDLVQDRLHELDRTGMFAPPMRQHRLRDWQSDLADGPRDRARAKTECAHALEHASGRVVASGGGERHHPVRLGEG